MLPRTLEPELMDSDVDAGEYDAMDHSAVNRQFVTDLLATVRAVGWVEPCETHHWRGKYMVGLAKLDPPYGVRNPTR